MTLRTRIVDDLKAAMKSRDATRVSVLRMLKTRMTEAEVAQRGKKGRDYQLDDDGALRVLSSYAKQRRDSIASFVEAGREELAERERQELAIVESYLPQPLTDDELLQLVRETIAEVGATSVADSGPVMKSLMPRIQGRADGRKASALVREALS